jgi:hypothetical protein
VISKRRGSLRRNLYRLAPFGSMAGLGAAAAAGEVYPLAVLFGIGAVATGRRLLDRRRTERKELWRRARRMPGSSGGWRVRTRWLPPR